MATNSEQLANQAARAFAGTPSRFTETPIADEKKRSRQRIFCIRHGQTALDVLHRSDGWLDLPLSDEGRQNIVVALAKFLKKIPFKAIFTAPLRRTEETAHIIQSGMPSKPPVHVVPDIMTWNLGNLSGEKKKPNKAVVKSLMKNPEQKAPDGESYREFSDRFTSVLHVLKQEAAEQGPFLMVLSGSNCRFLSEAIFGNRDKLDMDESGIFVLYPDKTGKWTAKVIDKKRTPEEIEKNPEAS